MGMRTAAYRCPAKPLALGLCAGHTLMSQRQARSIQLLPSGHNFRLCTACVQMCTRARAAKVLFMLHNTYVVVQALMHIVLAHAACTDLSVAITIVHPQGLLCPALKSSTVDNDNFAELSLLEKIRDYH